MNKSLNWRSTSLKIDSASNEGLTLIRTLHDKGIELRQDGLIYTLENQKCHYIFENEFISQSKNLPLMIKKYVQKNHGKCGKVSIFYHGEFQDIEIDTKDKKVYANITDENNIDGDIRKFPISVNVLYEVFDSDNNKSTLFIDILILLALANKSSYNAEQIKSEFRTEDNSYNITLNISDSESLNLYPIYDWIINDEEYEESYNVKLQIVRQVIINKKDIKDTHGVLEDSKLAYKRIISKKTNEYFEQLNQLKDDFLTLSKNENNALRMLNITFFAWLGYLGIELFNIVVNYEGKHIFEYLLWSSGAKKGIVLLMFMIALSFIFIGYVLEIKSLEKTYNVIKKIYKDKILFETEFKNENKFESTIKKPEIGTLQIWIFFTLLILLFVRFSFTFPW